MIRSGRERSGRYERSLECYLKEIGRYSLLSRQEEGEIARRIHEGDENALHDLVRANLRFVVTVAKQYLGQGLSLEDLINEGNIGLMKAARRFDERRGFKFISYAVWWIRQSILQAIADQSRVVRLPQNRTVILNKVSKAKNQLQQKLGRLPHANEIAAVLDLPEKEVQEAMHIGQPEVYLDEIVSEDDGRSFGDTLADVDAPGPEIPVMERSCREDLDRMLSLLPDREAGILRLYYGLSGDQALTLEEIGSRMGLTRERIRQLKERALHRLRAHERAGILMDHYQST